MSASSTSQADPSATGNAESSSSAPTKPPAQARQRIVIVPGNGCAGAIERFNWYAWLRDVLLADGYDVRLQSMPDPYEAKESIWLPFIHEQLQADENTVLVGHSSGAEAGMRFLERWPLRGLILVSACHTDLGVENERKSGYYDRAWEWEKIRANAGWIVQFHSADDPFIPVQEARHVAGNIKSEYIEHSDRGHYLSRQMQDVVDVIRRKCPLQTAQETKKE